jgi:chromosome segregation ATPase
MSNIHTLAGGAKAKYIGLGHRLGSAREIELEDALRSSIKSNSELTDEYRDLQDVYSKREEAFRHTSSVNNDKISQLNAENKSFKSNIKTLKRELTLARKASSVDKVKILSLETKIRDLEGKLEDIDLEHTYHDLDAMGGMVEEPAQINGPKETSSSDPEEIDYLRLELERAKEDRNSKEYTIECMEKGVEASNSIFRCLIFRKVKINKGK